MDIRPRMEFRKAPQNVRALHTLYLGSSGDPIADVHVEGMAEQLIDGWNYRFRGDHSRMQRENESLQQLVTELRGERDAAWQVGRDSMASDIEDIRRERDSAVQQLAVARDVIAEKHAQIVSDNDEILALRAEVERQKSLNRKAFTAGRRHQADVALEISDEEIAQACAGIFKGGWGSHAYDRGIARAVIHALKAKSANAAVLGDEQPDQVATVNVPSVSYPKQVYSFVSKIGRLHPDQLRMSIGGDFIAWG